MVRSTPNAMVHVQRKQVEWQSIVPGHQSSSARTKIFARRASTLLVLISVFTWRVIYVSPTVFEYDVMTASARKANVKSMSYPAKNQSCFRPLPFDIARHLSLYNLQTLPKPWIHIGMPKTGTTTLEKFWKCGLNKRRGDDYVSHSTCKVSSEELRLKAFGGRGVPKNPDRRCPSNKVAPCEFCGKCMGKANNLSMPLLSSCGSYQAWAQLDTSESCYYPQWNYVHRIHEEEPRATLIFMFRDVDKWVNSVLNFRKGSMIQNLERCEPMNWQGRMSLKEWFCRIVNFSRRFAMDYPSHTYIEIDLDDPDSSRLAAEAFGIEESCWGMHNVNTFIHKNETL